MNNDMMDVCPVCHEELSHNTVMLPGCNHRFHTSCVITSSQYDARCPVCRSVPEGVVPRRTDAESTPVPMITLRLQGLEEYETQRANVQQQQWRRYRDRRRRFLRRHTSLLEMYNTLCRIRHTMDDSVRQLDRTYATLCREIWRTNPEIAEQRKTLARLRRRERRIERTLYEHLHANIGSEPEEF